MHAADKLREARFFLDRLREHRNKRPEFRFYMSAFLGAARSVSFALQKDLRSPDRDSFDRWYAGQRDRLAAHPMGAIVNKARTVFQKEGNKLYCRSTYEGPVQDGPRLVIEYNLERVPLSLESIESIGVEFPPARARTLRSRLRQVANMVLRRREDKYWRAIPRGLNETDAEALERWVNENRDRLLAHMGALLRETETAWEVSLGPEMQRVPADELLTQLESYLLVLDEVVHEARRRFESTSQDNSPMNGRGDR